jgi:hypothetical protein
MFSLRCIVSGLRALFRREQVDRELDEELRAYVEMAVEEKMKEGMSRREATRAVRLERGSLDGAKETVRAVGWESWVETWWQDLRYAVRRLRRSPTFTIAALITLILAISANVVIFSVLNALVLKPLNVPDPAGLYNVVHEEIGYDNQSYPDWISKARTALFENWRLIGSRARA